MARPVQKTSLDGADSAQAGDVTEVGARSNLMMYVVAENLDEDNDTVEVEVEVSQDDGENWAKLRDESGSQIMQITVSELDDPDGNGDFAGYVRAPNVPADKARVNLISLSDDAGGDLQVTAYLGAFGRAPAQDFRTI